MKILLFSVLLLSSTVLFAQNGRSELPSKVREAFEREYPNINNEQWNQTNNQWHAVYRDDLSRSVDTYYDNYGNKKSTHTAWDKKDVPKNLDDLINSRYHVNGIYQVERIERPRYPSLFKIMSKSGTKTRVHYIDDEGRNRNYRD